MKKMILIGVMSMSLKAVANPLIPLFLAGGAITVVGSGCNTKKSVLEAENKKLKNEVKSLESDIENYVEVVSNYESKINNLNDQILDLESDLGECEQQRSDLFSETSQLISEYENEIDQIEQNVENVKLLNIEVSPICRGAVPDYVPSNIKERIAEITFRNVLGDLVAQGSYFLVDDAFKSAFPESEYFGNFVKINGDDENTYGALEDLFLGGFIHEFSWVVTLSDSGLEEFENLIYNFNNNLVSEVFDSAGYSVTLDDCVTVTSESVEQLVF